MIQENRVSRIVLISGAPCVGKTTVALEVAKQLGVYQCVGTDSIREMAREIDSEKTKPSLHVTSALVADQEGSTGIEIQARELSLGINGFLRRNVYESRNVIMEGIHLIPGIVEGFEGCKFHTYDSSTPGGLGFQPGDPGEIQHKCGCRDSVIWVLVTASEQRHRQLLERQDAEKKRNKMKYFDRLREYQTVLVKRFEGRGLSVVESQSLEQTVEEIVSLATKEL